MTKSTITREQVIALIAEHSYDSALVDALEHLLAAMDSEPVYQYQSGVYNDDNGETDWYWDDCDKGFYEQYAHDRRRILYRHAQQPVVPDGVVTAEHRRVIEMLLNVCGAAFELADDSCQQDVDGEDCHVVPDDAFQKLSDALDEIENTLPTEDIDRPDVFLAWSAMPRAALKSILQAGNSPEQRGNSLVIPDEMTPEQAYEIGDYHGDPVDVFARGANWMRQHIIDSTLAAAPQLPGSDPATVPGKWIPVSEQMPEVGDIVLTAMGGVVNVGETECSAANCRFFTSVISGRELPATHWMPLPAAPQEVSDA